MGKVSLSSGEFAGDLAATLEASGRLVQSYLPGQVFEVVRVADAPQLAVWLSIRVQALHNELGHLIGTCTRGGGLNKQQQSHTCHLISPTFL